MLDNRDKNRCLPLFESCTDKDFDDSDVQSFLRGHATVATPCLIAFLTDLVALLIDLAVLVAMESREGEEHDAALELTVAEHKGN